MNDVSNGLKVQIPDLNSKITDFFTSEVKDVLHEVLDAFMKHPLRC